MDIIVNELQRIKHLLEDSEDRRIIKSAQNIISQAISHYDNALERDDNIDRDDDGMVLAAYEADVDGVEERSNFIHDTEDVIKQGHDAYEEGEEV